MKLSSVSPSLMLIKAPKTSGGKKVPHLDDDNNNNNNNIYLLQLGCNPVAVVMLHVYKTRNWLLLNSGLEGYMRSM